MPFDPVTAALEVGGKLIDHFFPDPAQKAQATLQLLQLQQSGELAQLTADTDLAKAQDAINQAEAGSQSVWVAGWRPFIGWICGSALAANYIVFPLLTWGTALFGHPIQPPAIQLGDLIGLLTGMLGFGAMRTYEKTKGVSGSDKPVPALPATNSDQ